MFKQLIIRAKKQGVFSTLTYLICTVLLERLGVEIIRLFVTKTSISLVDDKRIHVYLPDDHLPQLLLVQIEDKCGVKYKEKMINKRKSGHIIAIANIDDCAASLAWLSKTTESSLPEKEAYWIIHGCLTFPEFRGNKLYPTMIKALSHFVAQTEYKSKSIYIESSWTNKASINGIKKCGFYDSGYTISFRDKILINKRTING
ncbi:MAG: hypothetical protein ACI9LM_000971 [Alteromonadaceae bacterium]|jgi:hypothetical protein